MEVIKIGSELNFRFPQFMKLMKIQSEWLKGFTAAWARTREESPFIEGFFTNLLWHATLIT